MKLVLPTVLTIAALIAAGFGPAAWAQGAPVEGKHYVRLGQPLVGWLLGFLILVVLGHVDAPLCNADAKRFGWLVSYRPPTT